ncbi:MAG: hypothetical protein U1E60_04245 [Reyranellaceae bacterium]
MTTINVALVLDRAHDPAALHNSDRASRQQQIDTLNKTDTMWSTYGADRGHYNQVLKDLGALGIQTVDQLTPTGTTSGYVSSIESRTIWVQVNETNFTTLFGPECDLDGRNGPARRHRLVLARQPVLAQGLGIDGSVAPSWR